MPKVLEPIPVFLDTDGTPLDNGMIYVGLANQDPRANPVLLYWDDAFTIQAQQPVRTLGGRPAFQGAPAQLFVSAPIYSIAVFNRNGALVVSEPAASNEVGIQAGVIAAAQAAAADAASAAVSASNASASASTAGNFALAAAASAASAVLAPGTSATSTTSTTVGTGSRTFTIQAGKEFVVGQFVVVARTSVPATFLFGQVTAHNPSTGSLTVDVTATGGSGTHTDWTIGLSGPSGSVGSIDIVTQTTGTLTVARGGTGATTAGAARTNLGATTVGANIFTLANPTAIRFLRVNADNTVTARSAADFRGDIGAAALGANADITSITEGVTLAASGTITAATVGFRGLPQNSQTAAYTLALADAGRHISITTGGVTIPANSAVAFPIGTTIVVYNNSGSAQNIAITSDTLRLAGTATTGTRSVAQRGLATLVKVAATEWVATGNVT
jgi:hypothetical protein